MEPTPVAVTNRAFPRFARARFAPATSAAHLRRSAMNAWCVMSVLIGLLVGGCYSATITDARPPEVARVASSSELNGVYSSSGLLYRHIYSAPVVTNVTSMFPQWNEYGSPTEGTFVLHVHEDEVRIDYLDGAPTLLPLLPDYGDSSSPPILKVGRFSSGGEGVSGHGEGTAKLLRGVDGSLVVEYDITFRLRSLFMPYTEREIFWAVYKRRPNQPPQRTAASRRL